MTTPDDALQVRDQPGRQVRARQLSHEVAAVIRSAHLSPADRARVLEAAETASAKDRREDLGGADYLSRQARSLDTPTRLGPTLDAIAARYVRPPIR